MEFCIKSNELNAEAREKIMSVLKREDRVEEFIQLYQRVLKEVPHAEIRGETEKIVEFFDPECTWGSPRLYYIRLFQNNLEARSSLPMKSILEDFMFSND